MQTNQTLAISDRLVIVNPVFSIWTGQRVFSESDFTLGEGGALPTGIAANLGQKNIVDPKSLNVFHTIKARAIAVLTDHGIPFMKGYAIPEDQAKVILTDLEKHVTDFRNEKAKYLANYDQLCEDWIAKHPSFEQQLRLSRKPVSDVEKVFNAGFFAVKITPLSDISSNLDEYIASMGSELLESISAQARKIGKTFLSEKRNRPIPGLLKIRNKLDGLSFLDSGISPVVNLIDDFIKKVPNTSASLSGPLFWECQSIIGVLSDPSTLQQVSRGSLTLQQLHHVQESELFTDEDASVAVSSEESSGDIDESVEEPALPCTELVQAEEPSSSLLDLEAFFDQHPTAEEANSLPNADQEPVKESSESKEDDLFEDLMCPTIDHEELNSSDASFYW